MSEETEIPDEEDLLGLLSSAENDCACMLTTDPRKMCRDGRCYHRTGNGYCERCAEGFGITMIGAMRVAYLAGRKSAAKPEGGLANE